MLVCRRMVDHIRMVLPEYFIQPSAVPDGTDHHNQVHQWIFTLELLLDLVGAVFINVKDNQLLRFILGNLPAELTADRAAAARY